MHRRRKRRRALVSGSEKLNGHMIRRQYSFLTAAAIFGLLICVGCQAAVAAEPKRVMLLHSVGREFQALERVRQSHPH